MDSQERVKRLESYVAHLVDVRRPWAEAWDAIRTVARPVRPWDVNSLVPRKGTIEDLISPAIMDNTTARALRILAAGLHSGLTPPSRSWFTLRLGDDDLMEFGPVKEWLHKVERELYAAFARGGFYPAAHTTYGDLAAFCSGCMARQAAPGRGVTFHNVPIGTFAWGGDGYGTIHTMVRHVAMTARDLVTRYGEDKVSYEVRRLADKEPFAMVDLTHVVTPREYAERRQGKLGRRNKPIASYLYENESRELVDEGGFDVFPYLCARWDVLGGEWYGRGAGFDNLPDIRMLQSISRDQAMAIRMSVTPPMKAPASMRGKVHLVPGGMNWVSEQGYERVGPLMEIRADVGAAQAKIAQLHAAIKEGFFNDLFLMLASSDRTKTAYEVAQLNSEKLLMLGPVIERHQTDILDPAISGTFRILKEQGMIPDPPQELENQEVKIEFISVLAQAQKMSEAASTRNIVQDAAGLAALDPTVLDKIDFDQVIDELSAIEGVPPKVIRSDDKVAALRQQRAQAQAEAQQMQMAQMQEQQAMEQMKAMGQASTEGTMLGEVAGGMAQAMSQGGQGMEEGAAS